MATIVQIMDGIETRLKTINGLNVSAYLPDQINPPQAIIGVPPIPDYRRAFGTTGQLMIEPTILIVTSSAVDRVGQTKLASYVDKTGAESIYAAIETDKTLGLTGVECLVKSFDPVSNMQDFGLIGYYGGIFTLACLATG